MWEKDRKKNVYNKMRVFGCDPVQFRLSFFKTLFLLAEMREEQRVISDYVAYLSR